MKASVYASVVAVLMLLAVSSNAQPARSKGWGLNTNLLCAVCETTVDLVEEQIALSKDHDVQVRFRIDEKRHVLYARSEFRVMEILESEINSRFDDFGVIGVAPNQQLINVKNMSPADRANVTETHEVRQSLKQCYQYLLHEHLDDMLTLFTKGSDSTVPPTGAQAKQQLCWQTVAACPTPAPAATAAVPSDAAPVAAAAATDASAAAAAASTDAAAPNAAPKKKKKKLSKKKKAQKATAAAAAAAASTIPEAAAAAAAAGQPELAAAAAEVPVSVAPVAAAAAAAPAEPAPMETTGTSQPAAASVDAAAAPERKEEL